MIADSEALPETSCQSTIMCFQSVGHGETFNEEGFKPLSEGRPGRSVDQPALFEHDLTLLPPTMNQQVTSGQAFDADLSLMLDAYPKTNPLAWDFGTDWTTIEHYCEMPPNRDGALEFEASSGAVPFAQPQPEHVRSVADLEALWNGYSTRDVISWKSMSTPLDLASRSTDVSSFPVDTPPLSSCLVPLPPPSWPPIFQGPAIQSSPREARLDSMDWPRDLGRASMRDRPEMLQHCPCESCRETKPPPRVAPTRQHSCCEANESRNGRSSKSRKPCGSNSSSLVVRGIFVVPGGGRGNETLRPAKKQRRR